MGRRRAFQVEERIECCKRLVERLGMGETVEGSRVAIRRGSER
jgi:hypothetical protein